MFLGYFLNKLRTDIKLFSHLFKLFITKRIFELLKMLNNTGTIYISILLLN